MALQCRCTIRCHIMHAKRGNPLWRLIRIQKLNVFHQRCLRKILYTSHTGIILQMKKFYTEQVLGGCQIRWQSIDSHNRTRLPSQRPARVAMNWTTVSGRQRKGRPRTTWRRTFQADLALVEVEEATPTDNDSSDLKPVLKTLHLAYHSGVNQAPARCALWHRWN